jgi:hypothetical protein
MMLTCMHYIHVILDLHGQLVPVNKVDIAFVMEFPKYVKLDSCKPMHISNIMGHQFITILSLDLDICNARNALRRTIALIDNPKTTRLVGC